MAVMKVLAATAVAAIAAASASPSAVEAADAGRRPNIIVIVADDLGYGDTSAYGSKVIQTPNIDALAADGVRFTSAYVTHPVCAPSRAAILTGRYQQRFGYEFNPVGRDRQGGVALSETMLPAALRSAGYRTGMVGKWHLGQASGYHPLDRGFDEFFGMTGGASSFITHPGAGDEAHTPPGSEASERVTAEDPLPPTATLAERGQYARSRSPILRGREPVEVRDYLTDAFSDEAVRFIGANRSQPFFLYLAYNAPHTPLQATKKYVDRYRHVEDKGTRVYAAMVSALDDGVGKIRAKLRSDGIERDTLIVFLSDNGCAAYILGACSNAPLNGHKGSHLEGGVRVPYIVTYPARVPGGRVDGRMISSLDIVPTAAALGGARLPKATDGVNLMPHLAQGARKTVHETLYWRAGASYAVRDGRWKLWQAQKAPPGASATNSSRVTPDGTPVRASTYGDHVMLYDLAVDPGETRNLAARDPSTARALQARLKAWDAGLVAPQWTSMRQSLKTHDGQVLQIYD